MAVFINAAKEETTFCFLDLSDLAFKGTSKSLGQSFSEALLKELTLLIAMMIIITTI